MRKFEEERFNIFGKIYPYIKPQKHLFIALSSFKVYFLIVTLITPMFYMILINDVMMDKRLDMLILVVAGYIGSYLLKTLGIVFNKKLYNKFFINFNLKLKTKILSNYTKLETKHYSSYESGDLKNRIDTDAAAIEKFLNAHCLEYIYAVLSMVVIGVILIYLNVILALIGLSMVPFSFLFAKFMGKKSKAIANQYRENYGRYEGFLHNTFQNWKEIKANNLEKNEEKIFIKYWDVLSDLFVKKQIFWYINRAFIAFKDFFITKMNLYFIGGLLIINDHMTVGALLVFMNYYEQFFENVSTVTNLMLELKTDRANIDRVIEMIELKFEEKHYTKILSDHITIQNLSFCYNDEQENILDEINLEIEPKEHIAIVGRSGCGKTTLAKLMLGMYKPLKGKVYIGDYNINDIPSANKKIGIVMQDSNMFNLTIRENLQMAKRRVTEHELIEVCKKADIYDLIQSLPKGFETIIGEKGIKLSGGQKQRVSIARAMLLNPSIIVFDEATSSLDNESEKAILEAIDELSKNKTIITIAHRLSSVIAADRVVVMDKGKIVAQGHHNQLRGSDGVYDLLFEKQYVN